MKKHDFYQFIKENVKTLDRTGSNCVGTSLYLVGEIKSDIALSRKDSKEIYSSLETKFSPERICSCLGSG